MPIPYTRNPNLADLRCNSVTVNKHFPQTTLKFINPHILSAITNPPTP